MYIYIYSKIGGFVTKTVKKDNIELIKTKIPTLMGGLMHRNQYYIAVTSEGKFINTSYGGLWEGEEELPVGSACYFHIHDTPTVDCIAVRFNKYQSPEYIEVIKQWLLINNEFLHVDWDVNDGYVIITNIQKRNAYDLGCFLLTLRNLYEFDMYKTVSYFMKEGFSPEQSVALSYVWQINDDGATLRDQVRNHTYFQIYNSDLNWEKFKNLISKGYFNRKATTPRGTSWSLYPHQLALLREGGRCSVVNFVKPYTKDVLGRWGLAQTVVSCKEFIPVLKKELSCEKLTSLVAPDSKKAKSLAAMASQRRKQLKMPIW